MPGVIPDLIQVKFKQLLLQQMLKCCTGLVTLQERPEWCKFYIQAKFCLF